MGTVTAVSPSKWQLLAQRAGPVQLNRAGLKLLCPKVVTISCGGWPTLPRFLAPVAEFVVRDITEDELTTSYRRAYLGSSNECCTSSLKSLILL